jgi:solute carrier family 25 carnitine/acylcarnitine transporter 20/29
MSTSSREGQRLWGASPTPVELNEFLFLHRNTVAAACGSFVSTIAGFPLDSVKSRLQVKR